eukprot:gene15885-7216_t
MADSDSEASNISSNPSSFTDHELLDESLDYEHAGTENVEAGCLEAYADEAMADAAWMQKYEETRRQEDERLDNFTRRLRGEVAVDSWCTCGSCNVAMLMNAMECYCCEELEGCITALNDPLVLNERPGEVGCITSHPGFEPCCLQPWVLRLTGQRFKRKDKLTYSKIKTEEA